MKRRAIRIRSQSEHSEQRRKLREIIETRFKDETALTRFVDALENAGWSAQEVSDAMDANIVSRTTEDIPALRAFMPYNYPIVDQLMLSQGVYTGFRHDALNPNYALRNQGHSEVLWRRMTFGDTLMMQAAMQVSAEHREDDTQNYWRNLWEAMLTLMDANHFYDCYQAAATACLFALHTSNRGIENFDKGDLYNTFFRPSSQFYTGVRLSFERMREADQYIDVCTFYQIDDGDESVYLSAIVVMCYGMDNVIKSKMWEGSPTTRPINELFKVYAQRRAGRLHAIRFDTEAARPAPPERGTDWTEREHVTITSVEGGQDDNSGGITVEGQQHGDKKTSD